MDRRARGSRRALTPAARAQYSLSQILGIWAAATLPMGLAAWIPLPTALRAGPFETLVSRVALLTLGLIWLFVLSLLILYREEGDLRWSTLRRRFWRAAPRGPRSCEPAARLWLWLVPVCAAQAPRMPATTSPVRKRRADPPATPVGAAGASPPLHVVRGDPPRLPGTFFGRLADRPPHIVTARVKWEQRYRRKMGVRSGPARGLDERAVRTIALVARRVCRALGMTGFARIDLRLTDEGRLYVIEANPNPDIDFREDFARSARHVGLSAPCLLKRILQLGLSYRPPYREVG